MFDKFIILNQKPKNIIFFYITSLFLLLLIFVIILNFQFFPYFSQNAKIIFLENKYYLKLNIDFSDLKVIGCGDKIIIENNEYSYNIYEILVVNDKVIVYLEVFNLPNFYKDNGYQLLVKIKNNT